MYVGDFLIDAKKAFPNNNYQVLSKIVYVRKYS